MLKRAAAKSGDVKRDVKRNVKRDV